MTRPAFEMADIVRRKGRQFLERFKAVLNYPQMKAYRAVKRAALLPLAGIGISVRTVRTKHPSPTTHADQDAVRSVRRRLEDDGSRSSNAIS